MWCRCASRSQKLVPNSGGGVGFSWVSGGIRLGFWWKLQITDILGLNSLCFHWYPNSQSIGIYSRWFPVQPTETTPAVNLCIFGQLRLFFRKGTCLLEALCYRMSVGICCSYMGTCVFQFLISLWFAVLLATWDNACEFYVWASCALVFSEGTCLLEAPCARHYSQFYWPNETRETVK